MMRKAAMLAAVLGTIASRSQAAVEVSSCEEFAAVDRKTETEITFTNADFKCDEYTRLSLRSPTIVLKSSVGPITFSNLALSVYGAVTVEPDVEFTGIELVEKNGGALKLNFLSSAVFEGTATFTSISIKTTDLGNSEERTRKGAAIHNKGDLVFESDATFTGCLNDNLEYGSGPGGAISNHLKGDIKFMGNLVMENNEADDNFGGAEGGAIYNRGSIAVDGDASFIGNHAGRGGAIYQETWGMFSIRGFATFHKNMCIDTFGGAIANIGGFMLFSGGSLFDDNFAENSGDGGVGGAIYNYSDAEFALRGPTTFSLNGGNWGGAIFNQVTKSEFFGDEEDRLIIPVIVYPDDTVFVDNYGQFCNDVAYDFDEDTCGL